MKKPTALYIFGHLIPVEYESGLIAGDDAWGTYCEKTSVITIDDSLENEDLMMTLLHELFHALSQRVSLNQGIDKTLEEVIADTVSKAIVENFILTPR